MNPLPTSYRFTPLLCTVLFMIPALGCGSKAFGPYVTQNVDFQYEGERGPEHWAELSPDFAACGTGQRQSPIEISDVTASTEGEVVFHYDRSHVRVNRDRFTPRVPIDPGNYIVMDGTRYDLEELHFHRISEHWVDGYQYPLEGHLVHESEQGELVIVALLFRYHAVNIQLAKILMHIPPEVGGTVVAADNYSPLNLKRLVDLEKQKPEFYRYEGSLSVPPCKEGVTYLVLRNILGAHRAQQYYFKEIMPGNYRPSQPPNDRPITSQSGVAAGSP